MIERPVRRPGRGTWRVRLALACWCLIPLAPCSAQTACTDLAARFDGTEEQARPIRQEIDRLSDLSSPDHTRNGARVCRDLKALYPLETRLRVLNENGCFQRPDMAASTLDTRKSSARAAIKSSMLNEEYHCHLGFPNSKALFDRSNAMGLID